MQHVEALCRISCLVVESTLTHKLLEAQKSDEWTKAIMEVLRHTRYADFDLSNGILYKEPDRALIVVPRQMEDEIIGIAHRQVHFGVTKTKDLIEKQYYVPDLKRMINQMMINSVATRSTTLSYHLSYLQVLRAVLLKALNSKIFLTKKP